MCTANERTQNRNQVISLLEDIIPLFHEEEDNGIKFKSITEHSPYTEFGKLILLIDGDGYDMDAVRSAIERVNDKVMKSDFVTKLVITTRDFYPWLIEVVYDFDF